MFLKQNYLRALGFLEPEMIKNVTQQEMLFVLIYMLFLNVESPNKLQLGNKL